MHGARYPVVIVGLDAARQAWDVRGAVLALTCPVLTTELAKGVIPSLGPYTGECSPEG